LFLIGGLVVDCSGEYMIPDMTPYGILLNVFEAMMEKGQDSR
jgi:hypothetical protein